MTGALLRGGHYTLAPMQRRDVVEALSLCARDPITTVVPTMHLETASRAGVIPAGLWTVRRSDGLRRDLAGVVWCGANLTAVLPTTSEDADDARAAVAAAMVERLPRPAALVGEADLILDLWGRVEPWWGPARQSRECQVSMAIAREPNSVATAYPRLEPLRRAGMTDYDALLPAAVHMFVGEVGYDPLQHGREAYEDRLSNLVRQGKSYVQYGDVGGARTVVFKAEVGVVGGGVAQVQGVWVHPELRGQRIGATAIAELVRLARADHAPTISLYVNDFNAAALRAYESVGFERVGTFATIMF